jgi:hypothetical protein
MLHPNMKSNYENRSESIIKTKNVGSLKNEKLIPENNFVYQNCNCQFKGFFGKFRI